MGTQSKKDVCQLKRIFSHAILQAVQNLWLHHTNATKVKVEIALTENDNTKYVFRIYLTDDFSNSCPALTVVSPRLQLRDGGRFTQKSSLFFTSDNVE